MDFLTALRVFNFLCLPPKGFFIDKALCSVGSEVAKKLLTERLAVWVTARSQEGQESRAAWARGWEEGTVAKSGQRSTGARPAGLQEPGAGQRVAKPETGVPENRFLETDITDQLREAGI